MNRIIVAMNRVGIEVMTTRELFDFVTRYSLKEEEYDSYIEKVLHIQVYPNIQSIAHSVEVMKQGTYENEEQVFMSAFIPQNLFEVIHIEKDITNLKMGKVDEIFYSALTGIDIALKQAASAKEEGNEESDEEDEFEDEFSKSMEMKIEI